MTQELLGRVHHELLDVLNSINQDKIHHDGDAFHELLNDVEKALAQPEQEPVAYLCENAVGHRYFRWKKPSSTYKPIPLYTSPPQRKPLTDKDILADETLRYYFGQNGGAGPVSKQGRRVVDAIEAAHDIKEDT